MEMAEAAKMRAKVQWIEEGEKCTPYFLGLEKHRATVNTVFRVKTIEGLYITDEEEIVETFADHFKEVYNKHMNDNEKLENDFDFFFT